MAFTRTWKLTIRKTGLMAKKKSVRNVASTSILSTTADRHPRTIQFPCISFRQGEHDLVCLTANAKQLWELVKINKREEDKDVGYQRALSEGRADKIARFIDKGNVLPGSVIISFEGDTKIDKAKSQIIVPNRADAGWVIDGQHRLAGARRAKSDIQLPVVAFVGLSLEEQVNCFINVNREQIGVPSSLYYDLLKFLPPTKTDSEVAKERAADLASRLKSDESSPFYGRIVVTIAPKRGEISLTNFVRKLSPLLKRPDGRLTQFLDDEREGVLNNFYNALHQVFPAEYKKVDSIFFKTLGFGALINVLPTFLDMCLTHYHGFRVADAVLLFRKIDYFDFAAWHKVGTGSGAEIQAGEDLRTALQSSFDGAVSQTNIKLI